MSRKLVIVNFVFAMCSDFSRHCAKKFQSLFKCLPYELVFVFFGFIWKTELWFIGSNSSMTFDFIYVANHNRCHKALYIGR